MRLLDPVDKGWQSEVIELQQKPSFGGFGNRPAFDASGTIRWRDHSGKFAPTAKLVRFAIERVANLVSPVFTRVNFATASVAFPSRRLVGQAGQSVADHAPTQRRLANNTGSIIEKDAIA